MLFRILEKCSIKKLSWFFLHQFILLMAMSTWHLTNAFSMLKKNRRVQGTSHPNNRWLKSEYLKKQPKIWVSYFHPFLSRRQKTYFFVSTSNIDVWSKPKLWLLNQFFLSCSFFPGPSFFCRLIIDPSIVNFQ